MEVFEEHNLWKANGLGTAEKQQEFETPHLAM